MVFTKLVVGWIMRSKKRDAMTKEKAEAILDYVIRWLDDNIDDAPLEGVSEDSANLKEKIKQAQDPRITVADIESGIF
jgi:hypothetical protein